MIEVTAYEKNTDNKNKITIKKEEILYDEKTINDMILDGNKYDEIDTLKCKLYKKFNKLKLDFNNLKYNSNNDYINLNEDEKNNLLKHLDQLKIKMNEIIPYLERYDLNNEDYIELIQKVKKLLKINDKKYPMLTQFYDNDKNKDIVNDNNTNSNLEVVSKELNLKLNEMINSNIKSISNLTNISKYTKKNAISFLQNKSYKLESIILDEELLETNIIEIKNILNTYFKQDTELINSYGNLNTIQNLLTNNNIDYDITKFYNLNSLEIFDLLFDICQQFNVKIN
jgi:hypothetical protein